MTKAVAKELIDATPAKLRSAFMKRNPTRRPNFSLFGKAKTSEGMGRLEKEAYHRGYLGNEKSFGSWLKRSTPKHSLTHHSNISEKDLRRAFSLGESARQDHEANKKKLQLLKQEKASSPKAPPIPKGEKTSDQNEQYKGLTINRTAKGFEVKGETWNTLRQAKEYADYWVASGGKIGTRRNMKRKESFMAARFRAKAKLYKTDPKAREASRGVRRAQKRAAKARNSYTKPLGSGGATLTQGKARADIFESGGKHTAQIVTPGGGREEHSFSGPGAFKAAMSWARLRLHEVANPTRFKVYPLTPGRRKNPAEPAARMYEKFHGTPSTEVREYIEEVHRHSWLAGLGPLVSIDVRSVNGNKQASLPFPEPDNSSVGDVVMLCTTEDGTQLIPVGGDQELDPKSLIGTFGMVPADFARDNVLIGTITEITYRTKKSFEKDGKEEIDFFHALGSEGSRGVYPVLIYHPRNPSLEIAGGRYYIGKAEATLGNVSPGIIG